VWAHYGGMVTLLGMVFGLDWRTHDGLWLNGNVQPVLECDRLLWNSTSILVCCLNICLITNLISQCLYMTVCSLV
jgi:hypothetical protein